MDIFFDIHFIYRRYAKIFYMFKLVNVPFPYFIKYSNRSHYLRLRIVAGEVTVTAPVYMPNFLIKCFVFKHRRVVESELKRWSALPAWQQQVYHPGDYLANKKTAQDLIIRRLEQFNLHYHFVWSRVSIKNQRSRWGSCSESGNLNFNYKIIFLPSHLQDYIVVHELCHLKELNHTKRFWDLVGETIPDYAKLRQMLKTNNY